jgi:hypothetical protein
MQGCKRRAVDEGLGGPILESAIIRLAIGPDDDVRGVIEWVRTGESRAFDSGMRLLEILRGGSRPFENQPSVHGAIEE